MRRRDVIALLGGAAMACPSAARAQRPPLIAYASPGSRERTEIAGAFFTELARQGYAEGRNLNVLFYDFLAEPAAVAARAKEFVHAGVDVIVADGPEAPMREAYEATRAIPIVVVAINYDPVERGYAASLSHPGGNVTGIFLRSIELAAKQVELLKTLMPDAARLTVLWAAETEDEFRAVATGASGMGIELRSAHLDAPPYDFDAMFRGLADGKLQPVLVLSPPFFSLHREAITAAALRHRVPAIFRFRSYVDAGGLMSYGVNRAAMSQRAAIFVAKILRGAKPAELPIERADKFELVINLKTANALGLAVPSLLRARADEVIE
jgi:putative tryptophan/tyrosine transport system substrate-binding protein